MNDRLTPACRRSLRDVEGDSPGHWSCSPLFGLLTLWRFLFAFDRRSPKRLSKNQAGQNVVLHIRELVTISSGLQMEKGRFSDFVYEQA
ncbi:hypothetical protein AMECASPLE_000153 [Ameca splendens]|uniref:Uncharacterized protein n=1 Tax=Ameca splendens TaxID=208324 RepID=A0ABV0YJR0_9TELE